MSLIGEPSRTIEVFFSYAQKDCDLRNEIEKRLSNLKRQNLIKSWYDHNISAGEELAREIDMHLNTAQIILLLVSPDFMASDYCYSTQVKRAIERHIQGKARVIPIILRPVIWQDAPFSQFKVLPTDGKPITKWGNRDDALLDVAKGIREVVKKLSNNQGLDTSKSNQLEDEENTRAPKLEPPHQENPQNIDPYILPELSLFLQTTSQLLIRLSRKVALDAVNSLIQPGISPEVREQANLYINEYFRQQHMLLIQQAELLSLLEQNDQPDPPDG